MTNDLTLLEAQQDIHELIAQQAPLETTLDAIARWIGIQLPGAIVAFMRFDPTRCSLSLYPCHRFSQAYYERLQDVPIGPTAASFGAAAYLRRQVITEDIQTDSRWECLRSAALTEGLRACWSNPVTTAQGELLGTFCTYYRQPSSPCETILRRLRQAATLVALAIIKHRNNRHHQMLAERHRSLFVNHPAGVYELDLKGRFLRGNAALERITGYPEQDLVGHHFNEFISPDYRDQTQAAFDAARAGASRHYETQGTHADGHPYYLEVTNFPVTVEGEVVGVYGICQDITQRKRQEAELRLLQRGIEASPNGILMVDACQPDMPIVYANERLDGSGYPAGKRGDALSDRVRLVSVIKAINRLLHARNGIPPHTPLDAYRLVNEAAAAYDKAVLVEYIQAYGLYPIGSLAKFSGGFLAWVMDIDGKGMPTKVCVVKNLRFPDTNIRSELSSGDFSQIGKLEGIVNPADYGVKVIKV